MNMVCIDDWLHFCLVSKASRVRRWLKELLFFNKQHRNLYIFSALLIKKKAGVYIKIDINYIETGEKYQSLDIWSYSLFIRQSVCHASCSSFFFCIFIKHVFPEERADGCKQEMLLLLSIKMYPMIYFIKSQTDGWILPVYLWVFNVVAL